MSVVKQVSRGIAWNTAAIGVGKVLIFVNAFIILNFLSLYEYGFTELVMSVISMISIFMLPGLTNAVIADLGVERGRENREHMKRIFLQYATLNVVLGISAWAVLFFGSHPAAEWAGNPYASQFIRIASFIFLVSPMRQLSAVLATVMLRYFDMSFYGVFEEAFKFILLCTFVVGFKWGIHGLLYATVLSQALVVVAYIPRTLSAYRYFSDADVHDGLHFWKLLGAHRKWSVGSSYVSSAAQNLRIWVIKLLLGTEAVGVFAYAYGIYSHVASLLPIATVLTPIIPRYIDKRDQLLRIIRASVKVQLITGILLVVATYATGYLFTAAFFPKYLSSVPLLYIIVLGIISSSVVTLFNPVFAAFKEQQSQLISNTLKLICVAVLLPPAIMLFGLYGVGIEIVATTYLNGLERFMRLRRLLPELRFSWRDFSTPDNYEREATKTVLTSAIASLPGPVRRLVDRSLHLR